jgi:hypothetical protein
VNLQQIVLPDQFHLSSHKAINYLTSSTLLGMFNFLPFLAQLHG